MGIGVCAFPSRISPIFQRRAPRCATWQKSQRGHKKVIHLPISMPTLFPPRAGGGLEPRAPPCTNAGGFAPGGCHARPRGGPGEGTAVRRNSLREALRERHRCAATANRRHSCTATRHAAHYPDTGGLAGKRRGHNRASARPSTPTTARTRRSADAWVPPAAPLGGSRPWPRPAGGVHPAGAPTSGRTLAPDLGAAAREPAPSALARRMSATWATKAWSKPHKGQARNK
jgi:hypothetical protein